MCEVLKYLVDESGLLIPPETLADVHAMDHYTWQKFVDRIKGNVNYNNNHSRHLKAPIIIMYMINSKSK